MEKLNVLLDTLDSAHVFSSLWDDLNLRRISVPDSELVLIVCDRNWRLSASGVVARSKSNLPSLRLGVSITDVSLMATPDLDVDRKLQTEYAGHRNWGSATVRIRYKVNLVYSSYSLHTLIPRSHWYHKYKTPLYGSDYFAVRLSFPSSFNSISSVLAALISVWTSTVSTCSRRLLASIASCTRLIRSSRNSTASKCISLYSISFVQPRSTCRSHLFRSLMDQFWGSGQWDFFLGGLTMTRWIE